MRLGSIACMRCGLLLAKTWGMIGGMRDDGNSQDGDSSHVPDITRDHQMMA